MLNLRIGGYIRKTPFWLCMLSLGAASVLACSQASNESAPAHEASPAPLTAVPVSEPTEIPRGSPGRPAMPSFGPGGRPNEVVVLFPPCVTPIPVADYRELIPVGSMICSTKACVRGFDIPGQPTPTPYPRQPEIIDPAKATIVYRPMWPCKNSTSDKAPTPGSAR